MTFSARIRSFNPFSSLVLAAAVALTGCSGGEQEWNSKDITGLMPELKYEMTDTSGQTVTEEAAAGNVRLMFFGFTNCPDVCPTTLQKLSKTVKGLPEQTREDVQIIFVSVDPNRDKPENIKNYVEFFGDNIIGLTSSEENLRELSKRYRTTFGYEEPDENGNYAVSHSGAVYVFDRQGDARLLVRSDVSMDALREDIAALAETDV